MVFTHGLWSTMKRTGAVLRASSNIRNHERVQSRWMKCAGAKHFPQLVRILGSAHCSRPFLTCSSRESTSVILRAWLKTTTTTNKHRRQKHNSKPNKNKEEFVREISKRYTDKEKIMRRWWGWDKSGSIRKLCYAPLNGAFPFLLIRFV